MPTLTTLIIDWIGSLEGVYGTRTSLIINVIVGTEAWRIHAVSRDQANLAIPHFNVERTSRNGHEIDLALARELAVDGRRSVASLAETLQMPTTSVHRRPSKIGRASCRERV